MDHFVKQLFYLFICLMTGARSAAQPACHVILVSIDGLRPAFYLDKTWPAPNLQWLMKQGLYSTGMQSVFPSYTYPSHTAMVTGALPARSGIFYNAPIGSKGDWNWFTSAIKVPTIWQVLKKAGLSSAAVEWPVSVDSNITYNIPEIWPVEHPEDRISKSRKYATKGLLEEIELNATGRLDSTSMNEEYFSMDANSARMAAYIFTKYKPSLLAVHFAEVDGMEHAYGGDGDSVRLAVAAVDRAIGDILEAVHRSGLADSTVMLIVGDHGFSDIQSSVRPNIWLAKNNLAGKARFQPAGGSAFLYLQDQHDTITLRRIRSILDTVSQRSLFSVMDRKGLDKLGADSSAFLALAARAGIIFGNAASGDILTAVNGGHHGYDPRLPEMKTGFIAFGNGINRGALAGPICVTDIAPLVMKILGLPFSCTDGKIPAGIFQ